MYRIERVFGPLHLLPPPPIFERTLSDIGNRFYFLCGVNGIESNLILARCSVDTVQTSSRGVPLGHARKQREKGSLSRRAGMGILYLLAGCCRLEMVFCGRVWPPGAVLTYGDLRGGH